MRTQNDCWEVLAAVVAGHLVPAAPRENGYVVVRNLARALSVVGYASFRLEAGTALQQPGALTAAWSEYREGMPATAAGRRLLETRAKSLDEFITTLIPRLQVPQVLGILDLVYRERSFSGMPDVTCLHDGRGLFIEVKAPGDSIRPQQVQVRDYLRESLHLDVWIYELEEQKPGDRAAVEEFQRSRKESREALAAARSRIEDRLGLARGSLDSTLIPGLAECSATELMGFVRDCIAANMRFIRHILQANIGILTDTEPNPEFAAFVDGVLSDREREMWFERIVNAYEARVELNASDGDGRRERRRLDEASERFREMRGAETAAPERAVQVYRESIATFVAALHGRSGEWLPSHILYMVNRLTMVLERLGLSEQALAELEACEALNLPLQGPKDVVAGLQKRKARLELRLVT